MSDWAGFWLGLGIAAAGFWIGFGVNEIAEAWKRVAETIEKRR